MHEEVTRPHWPCSGAPAELRDLGAHSSLQAAVVSHSLSSLTSRQFLTFALASWISFNGQIYKAKNGCGWQESRLVLIPEKNEPSMLEGTDSPCAQHSPGVIRTGSDWGGGVLT